MAWTDVIKLIWLTDLSALANFSYLRELEILLIFLINLPNGKDKPRSQLSRPEGMVYQLSFRARQFPRSFWYPAIDRCEWENLLRLLKKSFKILC